MPKPPRSKPPTAQQMAAQQAAAQQMAAQQAAAQQAAGHQPPPLPQQSPPPNYQPPPVPQQAATQPPTSEELSINTQIGQLVAAYDAKPPKTGVPRRSMVGLAIQIICVLAVVGIGAGS